jgi:hypothetical protein
MSAGLSARSAQFRRNEPTRFTSASDDEVGGFHGAIPPAMFAPPIWRRSRRTSQEQADSSSQSFRRDPPKDGGYPANTAASGASH